MTDLRSREQLWNGVAALALLILVGVVLFDLLVPKPVNKKTPAMHNLDEGRQIELIASDKKQVASAEQLNNKYLWTLPIDQIGPTALSTVTAMAKSNRVNLIAFRPQKTNEQNGLLLLPYLIVLEGGYPQVTSLLRGLETTNSKLAVNLVQIAAADQSTDQVNASIGVIAYTRLSTVAAAPGSTPSPAPPSTKAKPQPLRRNAKT